jgi:PHD/YefM family antitoxin component YafN of YafNO toxin-antitoxin module
MSKRVNISTARKNLPALFDQVTRSDRAKVIIQRRDGEEQAVLVGHSYLERLEIELNQSAKERPLALIGSARLSSPLVDVVAELRESEGREIELRVRDFLAPSRKAIKR